MPARDKILTNLKNARKRRNLQPKDMPDWLSPIYYKPTIDLSEWFKENAELAGGEVINVNKLIEVSRIIEKLKDKNNWKNIACFDDRINRILAPKLQLIHSNSQLLDAEVGITTCEYLVANLGSVIISSKGESGRQLHIYPKTHIIIASESQIVWYLDEAMKNIEYKYSVENMPSQITSITGPSKSIDIEKNLVAGIHGSKQLIIIICNEDIFLQ